jgi:uncharacterized SAM-binding protein YcdF (DUF218 family)
MIERIAFRRRLWRLATAAALPPVALLAGFIVFIAAVPTEPPSLPPAPPGAGIVVLTGGAGRIAAGLRLLAAEPTARLLVSGVHQSATLAELEWPDGIAPAVFAGRITLGRRAGSTRGNAAEAAAWAREHGLVTLVVVTAGYHMPRALLMLRRVLPEARLLPRPVTPAPFREPRWWLRPGVLRLAAGEYVKLLGALAGLAPPDPGVT